MSRALGSLAAAPWLLVFACQAPQPAAEAQPKPAPASKSEPATKSEPAPTPSAAPTASATRYRFEPLPCPATGFALSPDGRLAALAGGCGLVRVDLEQPDGAPRRLVIDDDEWVGDAPGALAIDDGGRAWLGSLSGFAIVGADDRVEHYPLARLIDIAGPVDDLLVTGAGPAPPTLGPERRAGLRATLVTADGEPLANATVELCDRPRWRAEPDPTRSVCAGAPVAATAQTNAAGEVEVADVPLGGYLFAVGLDGRWGVGRAKALAGAFVMRPGMVGNVGKVTVTGLEI